MHSLIQCIKVILDTKSISLTSHCVIRIMEQELWRLPSLNTLTAGDTVGLTQSFPDTMNAEKLVRTSVPSPKCGGPIDAEIDEEHFPGLHLNPVLTSEEWWCPRQWRSQFLSFLLCASLSFMTIVLPMHVNVFCRLFFPLPIRNLSSVTLISPAVSVFVLILLITEEETGVWGIQWESEG